MKRKAQLTEQERAILEEVEMVNKEKEEIKRREQENREVAHGVAYLTLIDSPIRCSRSSSERRSNERSRTRCEQRARDGSCMRCWAVDQRGARAAVERERTAADECCVTSSWLSAVDVPCRNTTA
eukprot:768478-Hanusia_phi.AAC.1